MTSCPICRAHGVSPANPKIFDGQVPIEATAARSLRIGETAARGLALGHQATPKKRRSVLRPTTAGPFQRPPFHPTNSPASRTPQPAKMPVIHLSSIQPTRPRFDNWQSQGSSPPVAIPAPAAWLADAEPACEIPRDLVPARTRAVLRDCQPAIRLWARNPAPEDLSRSTQRVGEKKTVGRSSNVSSETDKLNSLWIEASRAVAISESPPKSKKLSRTPIGPN